MMLSRKCIFLPLNLRINYMIKQQTDYRKILFNSMYFSVVDIKILIANNNF